MADLLRRQAALEKTLRKYRGRPLDWQNSDCVRMARSHLVAMGRKGLPKLPHYRSMAGAVRALKGLGFVNLEALFEAHLERIAPAAMLPGDLALMEPAAGTLEAVTICVGHKVFGWHEDNGMKEPVVIIPATIKAAFRA